MQKQWKYSNNMCIGCGINNETGEEIISCSGYGETSDLGGKPVLYSNYYYGTTSEMSRTARIMMKRLKTRENLMEKVPD